LYKKLFKHTGISFLLIGFVTIVLILLNIYNLQITKELFDNIVSNQEIKKIIMLVAMVVGIKLTTSLMSTMQLFAEYKLSIRLGNNTERTFLEKIVPKTVTLTEDASYRNDITFLRSSLLQSSNSLISSVQFFQRLIYLVTYGIVLFNFAWYLLPVIFIYSIPQFIFNIRSSRKRFSFTEHINQQDREKAYISESILKPNYQSEIILLNVRRFFVSKWNKITERITKQSLVFKRKELAANFGYGLSNPVGFGVMQVMLIAQIFNNNATIGDYASILVAVSLVEVNLLGLAHSSSQINHIVLTKKKLSAFWEKYHASHTSVFENATDSIDVKSIHLRLNSFTYYNQNQPALRNIDIEIKSGDFIAIVGENGSGKSTLSKILLGLHDLEEGALYYNDQDVTQIDRSSLYSKLSIVNQNYMCYPLTLYENIVLEDIQDNSEINHDKLQELKKKYPYLLPDLELETLLGNEFSGSVQLSGGQWQRVAIARGLYKQSNVLVIDEATSALDPQTALRLIQQIKEERKDLITIMVTHQMELTRQANKIFIMNQGSIVNQGSYDEVIDKESSNFNLNKAMVESY